MLDSGGGSCPQFQPWKEGHVTCTGPQICLNMPKIYCCTMTLSEGTRTFITGPPQH